MTVVLQHTGELTYDLLNQLLGSKFPVPVADCTVKLLGEGVGLMASIARANLVFEDGSTGSLIHKCAAQNENRVIAQALNFYTNEINFYKFLAETSPLVSPSCLYAELEAESHDFLLILEDLGDEGAGNQLKGCTADVVPLVFQKAAELHAQHWGKTDSISWLHPHNIRELSEFKRDSVFKPGVEATISKFPDLFSEELTDIVIRTADQFVELFDTTMQGALTFVHGDYRVDNLFFIREPELKIVAVDWQNCGAAKGPYDVAYFMSQACEPAIRRTIEQDALKLYHSTLVDGGVGGYGFDECVRDYRLSTLISLITPIAVCGTLDSGNERGTQLGKAMLSRNLSSIVDWNCVEFLK